MKAATKESLEQRLKMLAEEERAAWRRLKAHEAKHGCAGWIWGEPSPEDPIAIYHERDCVVRVALLHHWCAIKHAADLPHPDPRMYQDGPPSEVPAATTTEGATT